MDAQVNIPKTGSRRAQRLHPFAWFAFSFCVAGLVGISHPAHAAATPPARATQVMLTDEAPNGSAHRESPPTPRTSPAPQAKTWVIVAADNVNLRAAPRDSARVLTSLWQGETLELRGRQLDYVQVWDHQRERGGFVRAISVRELPNDEKEAASLVPVVAFLRDSLGQEALGIGLVANYIRLADARALRSAEGALMLESLGWMADRFARRMAQGAPSNKAEQALLSAQQEVMARYGVRFRSFEREGQTTLCYDGDAQRRVLGLPANAIQLTQAVLALTRPECSPGDTTPEERWAMDRWRVEVLEQLLGRQDVAELPAHLRQRLRLRAATAWSSVAYQSVRRSASGSEAALRARELLAGIAKAQLTDADLQEYERAALRVNASRFALLRNEAAELPGNAAKNVRTQVNFTRQPDGQTCVAVQDTSKKDAPRELTKRCTYGLVWQNSLIRHPEGRVYTLAVQPLEAWRELWVIDSTASGWRIRVLPPADVLPGIGYAEFAGWMPGGKQMLVAREAQGGGKSVRSFAVMDIDSLESRKQAQEPSGLVAFQRNTDANWKRMTLAVR